MIVLYGMSEIQGDAVLGDVLEPCRGVVVGHLFWGNRLATQGTGHPPPLRRDLALARPRERRGESVNLSRGGPAQAYDPIVLSLFAQSRAGRWAHARLSLSLSHTHTQSVIQPSTNPCFLTQTIKDSAFSHHTRPVRIHTRSLVFLLNQSRFHFLYPSSQLVKD